MINLLPCPFCGGEAETDSYDDRAGTFDQCSQCGARVSGDGWNRRTPAWQPIKTAPRDGRNIWLADEANMCVGFWGGEQDRTPQADLWVDLYQRQYARRGSPFFTPTHWQPLPTPPSERAA